MFTGAFKDNGKWTDSRLPVILLYMYNLRIFFIAVYFGKIMTYKLMTCNLKVCGGWGGGGVFKLTILTPILAARRGNLLIIRHKLRVNPDSQIEL